METLYPSYNTPIYRSIPDLLETDHDQLSFREKHRVRIFDQFEPITDADLYPVEQLPHVDRSCQTTPLPPILETAPPVPIATEKKRQATWSWPSTKSTETFRVIKGLRDAQAENTYGFAYYNELSHTELNSPSTSSKQPRSRHNPRTAGTRLVPLEGGGTEMEISHARTNWEALMQHINDSIRDTNQQRMIGQYMITKLKREQTRANLPADQIELNKRCLEKLIQKYGTGLETIVAKEKEFERLIEAYQVFMRGDKKRHSKKRAEPKRQRKIKPHFKEGEEPLPAIGDLKAGRSQVGCKIRQDLRKEYGERLRKDKTKPVKPARVQLVQQPGAAPRPMQVRVRRSVLTSNIKYDESDEELPPTPHSEVGDQLVSESQLSVTYVPSEASLAAPEDEGEGLVVITQEGDEEGEVSETKSESGDECLMLEGDSGSDVLLVDSSTELVQSEGARTPNFTIEEPAMYEEESKEEEVLMGTVIAEETRAEVAAEEAESADKAEIVAEAEAVVEKEPAVEPVVEKEVVVAEPEAVKEAVEEPAAVAEEAAEEEAPAKEAVTDDAVTDDVAVDVAETSLVSLDAVSSEVELGGLVEDEEGFQLAAVSLVSDVLERLDSEVGSEDAVLNQDTESEIQGTESEVKKSVTFKSSPDISYYERVSPEEAAVTSERNDVSEDLGSAEAELDDEARALYHKVLSNIDPADLTPSTEEAAPVAVPVPEAEIDAAPITTPEAVAVASPEAEAVEAPAAVLETPVAEAPTGEELKENSPIAMVAKELTDEILRKIDTPVPEETSVLDSEVTTDAEYSSAAVELTNEIFNKISSQPSTPAPAT